MKDRRISLDQLPDYRQAPGIARALRRVSGGPEPTAASLIRSWRLYNRQSFRTLARRLLVLKELKECEGTQP